MGSEAHHARILGRLLSAFCNYFRFCDAIDARRETDNHDLMEGHKRELTAQQ